MLAAVSDNRNRLLVVSGNDAKDLRATFGLEADSLSERKLQHRCMRAHLMQHSKSLNDPIVQVDQFSFGELVDVDLHLILRSDLLSSNAAAVPRAPALRRCESEPAAC